MNLITRYIIVFCLILGLLSLTGYYLFFRDIERTTSKTFYRAANGKDTASLALEIYKDHFFGQYEVYYGGKAIKDSGRVDGIIIGDTLRGKYKYRTYGGDINIIPIIFLKRNEQLILGKGIATGYMNFVYFMKGYPIEYDNPQFIFDKMNNDKYNIH